MKIGIGIISWNRPNYLKQTIESLEKNDLKDVDFHLFQDGYRCKFTDFQVTTPNKIIESIKVFAESSLPNKHFHIRIENVSIAINQFEAMRILADNYKQFIFIENDVIFSKNFISLMRKALAQFEKDKKIACISPGFRLKCPAKKVEEFKDKLYFSKGHFWAEGCWANKWNKIEKEYIPYYNLVKNQPYRNRPEERIKKLFNDSGHKMITTSQDNGKDWAIKMTGMKRVRFIVNRATGIGDKGFHSTKQKLKVSGDGHNKIYNLNNIKRFKIIKIKNVT